MGDPLPDEARCPNCGLDFYCYRLDTANVKLSTTEAALAEVKEERAWLEIEQVALLTEVREWMCDTCNTVYPGPPQEGIRCVVCPRCDGKTAPRTVIERIRLEAALAESRGEVDRLREKLEQREAFLREVEADNDAEPWDQHDELRRLSMALEAVTKNDLESLHLAASVLYGTQPAIAREFLARKHALEAPHEST